MADGWKRKMISCLNEIFVVCFDFRSNFLFFNFYSAQYWKGKMMSFKRDIIVLISFPIKVPSGVP